MAPKRKGSKSSRTDLTIDSSEPPPAIVALFLIRFDIRAGYTISWKRSIPDVKLENVVEFKSLPSGLHNVKEDLVYFVHEQYAGISAFVNQPAAESERNALMLAVGVLVPLSHGRLGKNWRHAAGLKELARKLAENPDDTSSLDGYWEHFGLSRLETGSPLEPPLDSNSDQNPKQSPQEAFRRSRALSDATALVTSKHVLAPFHPALSSPELIDTFGPLIFPLYRAALLRKRILLVGDAPMEAACNFVYNLSLLTSIPNTLTPLLPTTTHSILRPRPLFNICIHDMAYLLSLTRDPSNADSCWISCTSDRVLALKPELYDIVVDLPPSFSKNAAEKVYPTITYSNTPTAGVKQSRPVVLKATQRDARRYLRLKGGLGNFPRAGTNSTDEENTDAESTFSSSSIIEPLSWPLLAYNSFIWWASAGEKSSNVPDEETEQDARLLSTDVDNYSMYPAGSSHRSGAILQEEANQPQEIAILTYFRRLSTQIFTVLSDAIRRHDGVDIDMPELETNSAFGLERDEDNEDAEGASTSVAEDPNEPLLPSSAPNEPCNDDEPVSISNSDITGMGLDPWSDVDRAFVEALCELWFNRKAHVQSAKIKCCGIRIL
ncbi:hypothetical protein VTO42DRAFT_695 [Malbranchea cinnamomea]